MTIYSLYLLLPDLEPVCCSTSSSNCCFLTCIEISQEAGQVVWYSHLFKDFPQFVVIHSVKGFSVVNKAEGSVLLEFSCFFDDPTDIGNLISGSSAFSKSSLNIWNFMVPMLWKCCTQYASKFGKLSSGHRTGKVSFHSSSKERQYQRMFKLLHNCTHLTH